MKLPYFTYGNFAIFIMVYQVIKSDLFNIVKRIKAINPKYFVLYNISKNKFEVHYKRAKNTYELTIPYDKLDSRAVDFVLKTKIQNQKKLLKEIEESNKKLQGNLYGD